MQDPTDLTIDTTIGHSHGWDAALLYAHLATIAMDAEPWFNVTQGDLRRFFGWSRTKLDAARRRLVKAELIEEKRGFNETTRRVATFCRVIARAQKKHAPCTEKAGTLHKKSTNDQQKKARSQPEDVLQGALFVHQQPQSVAHGLTFDDILEGRLDGRTKKDREKLARDETFQAILLAKWAELWDVRRKPAMSDIKRNALHKALTKPAKTKAEEQHPSDFAAALVGMRYDEWPDRAQHNDWDKVRRSLQRWVQMYDTNKGRPFPTLGETTKAETAAATDRAVAELEAFRRGRQ